ncbi:ATP-binding protein [Sphingobacterium sp. UGAL515B_05]|uniref:ATP-binding protein n=1 Tax=Sphingobacterium sp. UGAL515B_05 TaxID=2986767 RepID=UPI002952F073|nr:ATP-binding protein [Sphingobacterium sp. UGAL515B_05]WON93343.1 ATP-binding protein [Sphingobacterium sp. UGAL515B_05]
MIENTFGIDILPENEHDRLNALRRYKITGTPSEASFDGIAKLATQIFNAPIALLSLVDAESVYFKANIGMGATKEMNRGKSLCSLAILDEKVTVFEDALREEILLANPNVIGDFGLQFYAGAPLTTHDGFMIGSLCIIDKHPRTFTNIDRKILEGLAQTAMDQIELRSSSIDKIDELEGLNITMATMQQRLLELNDEMELANDELYRTNSQLNKSYDLTVLLNKNLKKSERRFRSFIDKAPIAFAILTGRNLFIEVANDMMLKLWRKTETIIGKSLAQALPELQGQPYLGILDNVFTTGENYIGDTVHARLESKGILGDHYFDFTYEPLRNDEGEVESIIVIANEVTERIKRNEHLEALNNQLEIALKAGELGSYNRDIRTGKMDCSETCKLNFGLSKKDRFDYEDLMQSIVPEHREMVYRKVQEAIQNKTTYHAEYLICWPDGSLHWINASGLPKYDAEGNATHLIGVVADITKRKNYESQKDDFLGIASHELKTPVTGLKGTIQLLERFKDKTGSDIISRLIDQSAVNIKKIVTLVDDLLNMHRISEGQLHLEKTSFKASKILTSSCHNIISQGNHQVNMTGDLDADLFADEQRLEQVLVNFVNNAVKYAPESKEINIVVEQQQDHVKITVTDKGEGINPEVQPFIFDRYYRANHEGKSYSGLGLGLYISSEIIKKHNGQIGVDSTLGQGSSFWFSIPVPTVKQ